LASKVQERIYAEKAAELLGADWLFVDIPEPVDFEVHSATETFGLEIRQIFVDAEADFGSPAKRNESKNRRTVSALIKRYYKSGGSPISAQFVGVIPVEDTEDLAETMLAAAPHYPEPIKTIEASGVKIFITPLPASFPNYSRWTFVNDRIGWLRRVTSADLQNAINRKEKNLALYKKKYNNIDLLLVADRTFSSGKLIDADNIAVINPGFRAIYFLSYPESIERIG